MQANIRGVHHQAPDLEEDVQKLHESTHLLESYTTWLIQI